MLAATIFPLCTNILYSAALTALVRTAFEFFAFQPTRIAWQYGYETSPDRSPYRTQRLLSFLSVTSPIRKGRIQMLEDEEIMLRSLKYWETFVMMRS